MTADQVLVFDQILGLCQVNLLSISTWLSVQKLVNANPGLKVNQTINFSSMQLFFTAFRSQAPGVV